MQPHDIVAIGASAGGVEALATLVHDLPRDLPAALFVTVHFPAGATSVLPAILGRAGPLRAVHAIDGASIQPGNIYIAPPDRHLTIHPTAICLARGPTENGNRPAIDPMFRSAAVAFGARVIGIVLTGNLDDGTSGLLAIHRCGGVTVAQDPADALFPSMPASAIKYATVDHVVRLAALAPLLVELVDGGRGGRRQPPSAGATVSGAAPVEERDREEVAYSELDLGVVEEPRAHPGAVSAYSCPDCGGVLWEIRDGAMVRFRCRVGHAWTSDALVERQGATLDTALWIALRALEESAALNRQMAARMHRREVPELAERFAREAVAAEDRARIVRDVLMGEDRTGAPTTDPVPQAGAESRRAG